MTFRDDSDALLARLAATEAALERAQRELAEAKGEREVVADQPPPASAPTAAVDEPTPRATSDLSRAIAAREQAAHEASVAGLARIAAHEARYAAMASRIVVEHRGSTTVIRLVRAPWRDTRVRDGEDGWSPFHTHVVAGVVGAVPFLGLAIGTPAVGLGAIVWIALTIVWFQWGSRPVRVEVTEDGYFGVYRGASASPSLSGRIAEMPLHIQREPGRLGSVWVGRRLGYTNVAPDDEDFVESTRHPPADIAKMRALAKQLGLPCAGRAGED